MNSRTKRSRTPSQRGVALLVALFALLLISGVGISLIVMAGNEAAIDGNYRSSTQAFYAAYSGLEEARGRLSQGHPNVFPASFVPIYPNTLGVNQVRYVLNPSTGETVNPLNLAATNPYRDVEYRQEFLVDVTDPTVQVQTTTSMGTTNIINNLTGPLFKWVRITAKTEQSSHTDIDNHGAPPYDSTTPVYFDGGNQNLVSNGAQVYTLTALAVLPGGAQRMLHYDVGPLAPIPVNAAIQARGGGSVGAALNITGYTDPVCTSPDTYAVITQGPLGTSGSGNLTGGPPGSAATGAVQAPFTYNLTALMKALKPVATDIAVPATGVTVSGNPPVYSGPHATLGVAPTVVYNSSGAITSITAPGTPVIYNSPGDLILGTSTISPPPVTGQGYLLVNGNLTIDITNGFSYFGLILVTGNVTMIATNNAAASASIHGSIIIGGDFMAPIPNLSGSIFIHQNACLVQDLMKRQPFRVLAFREMLQ